MVNYKLVDRYRSHFSSKTIHHYWPVSLPVPVVGRMKKHIAQDFLTEGGYYPCGAWQASDTLSLSWNDMIC